MLILDCAKAPVAANAAIATRVFELFLNRTDKFVEFKLDF